MAQEMKQLRVKIFDELSAIVDPEINVSITELELIDEVDIQDSGVKVDLHLTSPFCPAVFGFKICQDVHDNLLKIDGIDDVKVNVSNHFMAVIIFCILTDILVTIGFPLQDQHLLGILGYRNQQNGIPICHDAHQ